MVSRFCEVGEQYSRYMKGLVRGNSHLNLLKPSLVNIGLDAKKLAEIERVVSSAHFRVLRTDSEFDLSNGFRVFSLRGRIREHRWVAGLTLHNGASHNWSGPKPQKQFMIKRSLAASAEVRAYSRMCADGTDLLDGVVSLTASDEENGLVVFPLIRGHDCREIFRKVLFYGAPTSSWFEVNAQSARWLAQLHAGATPDNNGLDAFMSKYFGNPEPNTASQYADLMTQVNHINSSPAGPIHGDFLPPNVVSSEGSIFVVDWENYSRGFVLSDCIQYVIGLLSIGRTQPLRWSVTKRSIVLFLERYASCSRNLTSHSLLLAVVAAVQQVKKWQRWNPHQRWAMTGKLYFPKLFKFEQLAIDSWIQGGTLADLAD